MKKYILILLFLVVLSVVVSFRSGTDNMTFAPKMNLSEYGFFAGKLADLQPVSGVIPYALNTPLFSDYAEKLRFVKLPEGATVPYNEKEVLEFPVGTTIIKTFYFPHDFRNPAKGRRIMETRLLIHEQNGWKALEYVWNDEQTDATLEVAGEEAEVNYIDIEGKKRKQLYVMPNLNQCKGCHNRNEVMTPIGPSIRQLNGELTYADGSENQLVKWQKLGILTGLPSLADCPKAPVWNKPETGSLEARARTWLDINCAHCHRSGGPASTSGLLLGFYESDPTAWGIHKTPVAAGRGSGNRKYSIEPGKPDESILLYRMESTDPGVMMPELGRKITHREGVALVREWIKSMPTQ